MALISRGEPDVKVVPEHQLVTSLPPFISKLDEILSSTNNYIKWGPSGDTIIVTDQVAFARQVLPQFFKHDNIRSFSRQLNIYGFQRCRSEGREDGHLEFYHEAFLRDRPDLMKNISRGVASQKRAAPGDDAPDLTKSAAGRLPTSQGDRMVQMRTLAEDMNLTSNQLKQLVEQLHVHIGNSQSKIVGLINALNTRMELHQRLALPQPPPFLSGSLGIGIHGHGWPSGSSGTGEEGRSGNGASGNVSDALPAATTD